MSTTGHSDTWADTGRRPIVPAGDSVGARAPSDWARQATLLELGRRTLASVDFSVLLRDAAEFAVEMLEADLAVVGELMAGEEGLQIRMVAPARADRAEGTPPHHVPLSPEGSLAVSALQAGAPLMIEDLARESRYRDPFLQELGVRAGLTVPLQDEGQSLGTLGIYWKQKRELAPEDVAFVETIACLLSLSLSRARAHARVDCEQAVAAAVLDMIDDPVVVLDARGHVLVVNWACSQATGRKTKRVRGKPFWEVFAVEEEWAPFRAMVQMVADTATPCQFDGRLLTLDDRRLPISWLLREVRDGAGVVRRILLVGRLHDAKTDASPEPGADSPAPSQEEPPAAQPFQPRPGRALVERRRSPRREYPYRQWIAPCWGDSLPGPEDFIEVACRDISAGGFSFLLDASPDFTDLVIALGIPPHVTHLAAEVRRVAEMETDGKKQFLVGCQFRGRLRLESARGVRAVDFRDANVTPQETAT